MRSGSDRCRGSATAAAGGRSRAGRWESRRSLSLPKDVSNPAPQPNDAPWAGMLGAAVSWSANDNRRLAALQVYAGCMGPCAAAEPVQKFVHGDLGLGPTPKGWDNQLVNKALFNVNYEYRYKLVADRPDRYFTP